MGAVILLRHFKFTVEAADQCICTTSGCKASTHLSRLLPTNGVDQGMSFCRWGNKRKGIWPKRERKLDCQILFEKNCPPSSRGGNAASGVTRHPAERKARHSRPAAELALSEAATWSMCTVRFITILSNPLQNIMRMLMFCSKPSKCALPQKIGNASQKFEHETIGRLNSKEVARVLHYSYCNRT